MYNKQRLVSFLTGVLVCLASAGMASATSFTYTGSTATYMVTQTGFYQINAFGAQGGGGFYSTGGKGAQASGVVFLNAGDVLTILVGGAGGNTLGSGLSGAAVTGAGGGGGGSFVVLGSTALVVAGGGGGGSGPFCSLLCVNTAIAQNGGAGISFVNSLGSGGAGGPTRPMAATIPV